MEPSEINRSAILIHPKEPFFKWLRSIPDPMELSPEGYNEDSILYLIPPYESEEELEEILSVLWGPIFEEILMGWWTVDSDWPKERTFSMFKEWFEVDAHSLVLDMVSDVPIGVE